MLMPWNLPTFSINLLQTLWQNFVVIPWWRHKLWVISWDHLSSFRWNIGFWPKNVSFHNFWSIIATDLKLCQNVYHPKQNPEQSENFRISGNFWFFGKSSGFLKILLFCTGFYVRGFGFWVWSYIFLESPILCWSFTENRLKKPFVVRKLSSFL